MELKIPNYILGCDRLFHFIHSAQLCKLWKKDLYLSMCNKWQDSICILHFSNTDGENKYNKVDKNLPEYATD